MDKINTTVQFGPHGSTESLFSREIKSIIIVNMNGKATSSVLNMNEIVSFLWGAKEILRGPVKHYMWGRIHSPICSIKKDLKGY